MDQNLIEPRFYEDTFGGGEYDMDVEENLGFRTPFLDVDSEKADALFDFILRSGSESEAISKVESEVDNS